jgi:hypothetical protein
MAWLRALVDVPSGLVGAYAGGLAGLDARTRERLMVHVVDRRRAPLAGWVHRQWLEFLGAEPVDDIAPLTDFIEACTDADEPVDATVLEAMLGSTAMSTVQATIALAHLHSAPEAVVAGRRVPRSGEAVDVVAGIALLAPALAVAGAMAVLARVVPALPAPAVHDDDDMAVHLVASSVPALLGNHLTRTVLVWAPRAIAVAFRIDDGGATLVVGQGRIVVEPGVRHDAALVVDGGAEPLARHAAAALIRQFGTIGVSR